MNILILTREMQTNNNTIYNSYTKGITSNYKNTIVMDYFDLYFNNGKKSFEKEILDTINKNSINIVFINFVSGELTFDLFFLKKLSAHCFLIMNFYDSELFFEPIDRYYAQCADLVLLPTSTNFTYNYKILNINTISTLSLFDISLYKNLEIEKDIDISFVGDITKKSRQKFINYLEESGYKVETYGFGTKNGKVQFSDMVDIFNRSKINLNFSDTIESRDFNKKTAMDYSMVPKIAQYINQLKGRTIEVALCKSFTLTQNANGIEDLFSKEQIGIFNTEEELLEKVKYYLQNDRVREEMAQSAYNKAIVSFNAVHQLGTIIKNIDITDKKEKVIYTDKVFLKNFYTYHTLYFFNFLFKFRLKDCIEEFNMIHFTNTRLSSVYNHFKLQFKFQIINKFFKGQK